MIAQTFLIVLSLLVSCSKAEQSKQNNKQNQQSIQTKQTQPADQTSPFYRYKDPELPFTLIGGNLISKTMVFLSGHRRLFGTELGQAIENDYENGIGYQDDAGGGLIISYAPRSTYPSPSHIPTLCFADAVKDASGNYLVNLRQFIKKSDGTYGHIDLPAKLLVLKTSSPEDAGEGDVEPGQEAVFPGGALSESQLIIPQLPSGSLPQGKTLFIKTRYYVITPDEPDYHKQAKQKANQQLCDAVKTFGWVTGLGTPPDWPRLRFSRDNNGQEWPAARINR